MHKAETAAILYVLTRFSTQCRRKSASQNRVRTVLSRLGLDGENLKGLTEQIEAIKKTDAYLFNEESKPQTATLPMFLHRKPQKQLTYTVSFDIIKA